MKKMAMFLIGMYPTLLIGSLIWAIMFDVSGMRTVTQEMQTGVDGAHNYCVKATQDIEGLQEILTNNPKSRQEYKSWLNAMERLQTITIDTDGNTYTSGTVSSNDNIFSLKYLKKLKEESNIRDKSIMTPLNFGITYLDRQKLENDALWYMQQRMYQLNDTFSANQYGLYKIDPKTLDVKVTLKSTPINLIDVTADARVREQYLKLFGNNAQTKDDMTNEGILSNTNTLMSNIIIKYDITYYVYYDFIPSSFFFKTNANNLTAVNLSEDTPPRNVYFPFWYDSDGNVNPNKTKRLSSPVIKWTPAGYMEYNYSYILAN